MIPVGKSMHVRAYSGQILRWFLATAAAIFTTFLLVWLGANSTTAGMVFLVLVVWSASQAGIVLSLYMAVLCAVSFDYYFLPPNPHFSTGGRADLGGDGLVRTGLRRCQPPGRAGAKSRPCRPSSARQMWGVCMRSARR